MDGFTESSLGSTISAASSGLRYCGLYFSLADDGKACSEVEVANVVSYSKEWRYGFLGESSEVGICVLYGNT
jgi:hypothetical protein